MPTFGCAALRVSFFLFETEAAGKSREAKEQDVEKTACTQVELETGLVDVYDFGNV